MIIYRLANEKYAHLQASGKPNRWNRSDQFVIYASHSVSLCALELLAHTSGIRPKGTFKIMEIEISEPVGLFEPGFESLPQDWQKLSAYHLTQEMGSNWYESMEHLLLKIPSAIVPTEFNYAINAKHPDFIDCVQIKDTKDFFWDHRFPGD